MIKNLLILLLLIAVIVEGVYIYQNKTQVKPMMVQNTQTITPTAAQANRPKPMLLSKGMKLADNPIAKFAHKIAPGDVSAETKQVMTGFNMTSQNSADGSVTVTLTPKDSDDQSQQYIVKSGETLYFIEQTPADDKQDQDKDLNYRDDYGVIVDQNGMVL